MQPIALIVDRHSDTRQMYAEDLKLASWKIEEADNGHDAWAKAVARHHDVIVTETRLPLLSGYDLCRMLKQHRITAAVPIVCVTGDASEPDVARAREAGADSVLIKPCFPDRLVIELNRQIGREMTLPAPGQMARGTPFAGLTPPRCPWCNRTLIHLEPVDPPDAFDYHVCRRGCGTFRYLRLARGDSASSR
jgi:two-component system cell cycle response regulator DivK